MRLRRIFEIFQEQLIHFHGFRVFGVGEHTRGNSKEKVPPTTERW